MSTDDVAGLSREGNNARPRDPLIGDRWSMATMKVLSSMPSRTIGESCRRLVETNTDENAAQRRNKILQLFCSHHDVVVTL